MFGLRTGTAVAEQVAPALTLDELRPRRQPVSRVGESAEIREYAALAQRIHAESSAVRMLQLRQFLAERGMPEYDLEQVHRYLRALVEEREKEEGGQFAYTWLPLRSKDRSTSFLWRWKSDDKYDYGHRPAYNKLVPMSVLQTVATILDVFPDASFYISDIKGVADPFLLTTFNDVEPVITDFWNEPGFRPS